MKNNMSLQSVRILALLGAVFAVSACSESVSSEQVQPKVQAVKMASVLDAPNTTERSFPAEVSAVKTLDVSFEVSGRLITENLQTGSQVQAGEILAQIDPTPFEQRLREATARLNQANRELARTESTFTKGLASQAQLDEAKTTQELAEIERDKAQQDLSYTTVRAPFNATVSERLIENNSYVRAGEVVAKVQDLSRFYFNVNVPERVLSQHQPGAPVRATASIVSSPNTLFALEYVEHATQPDPITQTYRVVFAADAQGTLTPGARAVVNVTLGYSLYEKGLLVPFSSLQGNDNEGFHVWRFDSQTSTVSRVDVAVQQLLDKHAIVNGELKRSDLVVAAGGSKMREGLTVKQYRAER